MDRSPFRSIFLPAIVASGAVFATITLPLSVMNAVPQWLSHWSTPTAIITSPDKSARPIIRYVGLSIVLSVGAGISVAEVMRRLTAHRRLAQPSSPQVSSRPDSDNGADQVNVPTLLREDEAHLNAALQPTVDFDQLIQAVSTKTSTESDWNQALMEVEETAVTPSHSQTQLSQTVEEWIVLPSKMIQQWLHLQVPTQQLSSNQSSSPLQRSAQTLSKITFGFCHDNTYYGLIRHTADRSTVSFWVNQLSAQGKTVVITQHGQQYRVWQALQGARPIQSDAAAGIETEEKEGMLASTPETSLLAS